MGNEREKEFIDRIAVRTSEVVRESFKRDAGEFIVGTVLRSGGRLVLAIALWEVAKALGPRALEILKLVTQ